MALTAVRQIGSSASGKIEGSDPSGPIRTRALVSSSTTRRTNPVREQLSMQLRLESWRQVTGISSGITVAPPELA